MKIGVLSLQGDVVEHLNQVKALGYEAVEVKYKEDLENIDAIILPGGESTTIGKLLNITGIKEPLKKKIEDGMPTLGTCAGMILLAKNIENDTRRHLALMDISVKRNAFGTQIDSFKTSKVIKEISNEPLNLVFIRAPYITEVSNNVEVLCKVNDNIVAARQDNILVTSFHAELTKDLSVLRYFIDKIVLKK